ncbi:uncharacterized protein LOC143299134 [Babylonia areolata]|uniref:uncharacterized protein LOC143299134 n=1 Tax=Babylonia areolata TaxID=304850 RepID=UPI003FD38D1D
MQALAQLPEKLRQRRRVRQRIVDHESPRAAFSNPKYGSTSRNFIFRAMAMKRITPHRPDTARYQEMRDEEEPTEDEETGGEGETTPNSPLPVSDVTIEVREPRPETACQKIYQRACAKLQVLPSLCVYENLSRSQMVLAHKGVGHNEVKAIAIALVLPAGHQPEERSPLCTFRELSGVTVQS